MVNGVILQICDLEICVKIVKKDSLALLARPVVTTLVQQARTLYQTRRVKIVKLDSLALLVRCVKIVKQDSLATLVRCVKIAKQANLVLSEVMFVLTNCQMVMDVTLTSTVVAMNVEIHAQIVH